MVCVSHFSPLLVSAILPGFLLLLLYHVSAEKATGFAVFGMWGIDKAFFKGQFTEQSFHDPFIDFEAMDMVQCDKQRIRRKTTTGAFYDYSQC